MDKSNRVAETIVKIRKFLKIRVCNGIYDTAINIHHTKYSRIAFQFQISLAYTPPEMQVNRNDKLNEQDTYEA